MAHRQSTLTRAGYRAGRLAALLCVSPVHAGALSTASHAEIEALLARLKASGCEFKRNGAWHSADAAHAHLQRKLDYLSGRGAVSSTEQFIERAATKSSVTGQSYLVKCGSHSPLPSGEWLALQLRGLRATPRAPAGAPE